MLIRRRRSAMRRTRAVNCGIWLFPFLLRVLFSATASPQSATHESFAPTFVSLIRSRAAFDLTKRACKFLKPASPASATGADACIRLHLALQRVISQRSASRGEELALSARELAA